MFFDFVETHIGWFLALKHILKGHAGPWRELGDFYLVFLKLSCVMWMLESLESGLWSCNVEHSLELLDLLCAIFVFCLIWLRLQIGTWGGVVRQNVKYPPPPHRTLFNALSRPNNVALRRTVWFCHKVWLFDYWSFSNRKKFGFPLAPEFMRVVSIMFESVKLW